MKKLLALLAITTLSFSVFAQQKIEWEQDLKLGKEYFQGEAPTTPKTGIQEYYLSANMDFSYAMGTYEFLFKKNFNKYVNVSISPHHSWMQDGEYTDQLLAYAQLQFDLLELYARKFRKSLYENKKAFSDSNFANELYAQIGNDYSLHLSKLKSDLVANPQNISQHQLAIDTAIIELDQFCKDCKPKKKK
ncbi:hypothetical protein DN752_07520 [Echinicola strongylocentroti]|uniref:Uncharacterized protein n=1 Tax=Echinicola strongylocentroti TaxID=1795355 RepID=A0A2Z4IGE5_9BACT|nr:hypothetical protein [Echinicola strongylocentroti]AWW29985.1 hypothetical protein DN752_07520 [Echinicola strongylocentroti]